MTSMPAPRRSIIAHHLIWTMYGHWLPNDLHGSGSEAVRDPGLAELGEVYHGRKSKREQPSRQELRAFHREAEARLQFPRFWIDEAQRQSLSSAIAEVVRQRKYKVWARAIWSNHAHMVVRRHRDDALTMWKSIAEAMRDRLRAFSDVGMGHPVLAARPYEVFPYTPADVRGRITYVNANPEKEGLSRQQFDFVESYANWPSHKSRSAIG
jgi:REP element-mobilizing transposase RayT